MHHRQGLQAATNGQLGIVVNTPPATKLSARGEVQRLAPSQPTQVFAVNDFADRCPANWMRDNEEIGLRSFFFAVPENHMVWFDLRQCARLIKHVAVVISNQGMNALSAREVTFPLALEQYKYNCPKHGTAFTGDRFCDSCGFAWPGQNYLATTATPGNAFWRDGQRGANGNAEEFVLTESVAHGLAASVIGDKRNHAFSFGFFLSKSAKPPERRPVYRGSGGFLGGGNLESFGGGDDLSYESLESAHPQTLGGPVMRGGATRGGTLGVRPASVKKLEVGRGAAVNQGVETDPEPLSFWENTPAGLIRLYYCRPNELAEIIGGGPRDTGRGGGGSPFGNVPPTGSTF